MRFPLRWLWAAALLMAAYPALGRADPPAIPSLSSDEELLRAAKLPTGGPELREFFRRRTASPVMQARLAKLIRRLGDRTFKVRQQAMAEILESGRAALPQLRDALPASDLERSRRIQICIGAITTASEPMLLAAAARVLLRRCPESALQTLLAFLPSALDPPTELELLMVLSVSAEHFDCAQRRVLSATLTDLHPVRRAAAALVLGRVGSLAQREQVAGLLADSDPWTRLRAAQGLIAAGDRRAAAALPALAMKEALAIRSQAGYLLECMATPFAWTDQGVTPRTLEGAALAAEVKGA